MLALPSLSSRMEAERRAPLLLRDIVVLSRAVDRARIFAICARDRLSSLRLETVLADRPMLRSPEALRTIPPYLTSSRAPIMAGLGGTPFPIFSG